jgi:hypothetical protein
MTATTRRRLTVCLVLGLITLPLEALIWPVVRTPDANMAAVQWAAGRSTDELRSAARSIDRYPAVYRRAIMTSLSPADRSDAWRSQFERFLAAHPELSQAQISVVRSAIELASSDAFTPPMSPAVQQRITSVFADAQTLLGPKVATELFVTLGPKEAVNNALPLTERLANHLRGWRVASANEGDCNCNIEIDTCDIGPDPWLQCSELYTCDFDLDWPMCGPFWAWACTGWCKIIRFPDM